MPDPLETHRRQFRLTWKLAEHHLPRLTDAACLWEPAPVCWTVHRGEDGNWRPDWAEREPDPVPAPTIGWLSWHLIWWWSGLLAELHSESRPPREAVFWPGSAGALRTRLERLAADWSDGLDHLGAGDLDRPLAFPWPDPRPLDETLAWSNMELMKNIAEIGYARLLYEASR